MAGAVLTQPLRDMAYHYGPYWLGAQGDWFKTLLLFFDGIAVTVPDYMREMPLMTDPVLAQPLAERGLLIRLSPEELIDEAAAENIAELIVEVLDAGAFDALDRDVPFVELSHSRLGGHADEKLEQFVLEELATRGLAEPSADGVSVPLHPAVRAFVLLSLPQVLRAPAEHAGYALHPASDHTRQVQALLDLLDRAPLPTAGHVVAADLEQVTLDLTPVPLDEVLDFRQAHGEAHRTYARDLRRFVRELSVLDDADRHAALLDRREALADAADNLRRTARKAWRRPLASFGLGIAGSAVSLAGANPIAAGIGAASALVGIGRRSEPGSVYSYLFMAQRQLSGRRP